MDCVGRGAGVEADALASVLALMPPDLKDLLPEEMRAAVGPTGAPAASAPTPTASPLVATAPGVTLETNQIGEGLSQEEKCPLPAPGVTLAMKQDG